MNTKEEQVIRYNKMLTKETLRKSAKRSKKSTLVFLIISAFPALLGIGCLVSTGFDLIKSVISGNFEIGNLIPFLIAIIFSAFWILAIVMINRIKINQIKCIENDKFKILEDIVYDKYFTSSTDDDGHTTYNYYLYVKENGRISVSYAVYNRAFKDDKLYLVYVDDGKNSFQLSDEYVSKHGLENAEFRRNSKLLFRVFFSNKVTIDTELYNKHTPYNENTAERMFNKRVSEQVEQLNKKRSRIKCKKCGKRYNKEKYDVCPECGTHNKFEFINIIYCKEWYR